MTTLATNTTPLTLGQMVDQQQAAAAQTILSLNLKVLSLESQLMPPLPTVPTYVPDKSWYAKSGTAAGGTGTKDSPFATWDQAYAAVKADRGSAAPAKLPGIYLDSASTFPVGGPTWGNSVSGPLYVNGAWNATAPGQYATITGQSDGFSGNNVTNFHVQYLKIISDTVQQGTYGIAFTGGDDISFDYVIVKGWKNFGMSFAGGITRLRRYYNFVGYIFDPNPSTMSDSGVYSETVAPDEQCCREVLCGWAPPYNPADTVTNSQRKFKHGRYLNPGNGVSTAGVDRYSIRALNAQTGAQHREGGALVEYSVDYDNGPAVDTFVGPGWNSNKGGEISHAVVFGSLATAATRPGGGGGLGGQSVADNIHDCLFAGNNPIQTQAAITISWGGGNGPTTVPLPANTTAIVANNKGRWLSGAVAVNDGRTATQTGNTIVPAKPGEKLPTLRDYFNVADDAGVLARLEQVWDPVTNADQIYLWAVKHFPQ